MRALSAVEVAGLGQLLCQLNATQWSALVPEKLAVGVMEAVLASLSCTLTDDVSNKKPHDDVANDIQYRYSSHILSERVDRLDQFGVRFRYLSISR